MARFLDKHENIRTRELFSLCFPDDGFLMEHYGKQGEGLSCRTAAAERDGAIVSMAQLVRRSAVYGDRSIPVWYIMGVCTHPSYRHRGLMDEVLKLVLRELRAEGEDWSFLMPVDKAIYRHLGFVHDFDIGTEKELELLYADDGLSSCSACLLCGEHFQKPEKIDIYP